MKKLMTFILWAGLSPLAFADTQDPFTFLEGNAVLAITQHGSLAYEYGERGTRNISLLDDIGDFVKVKNAYIFSVDAGINGATAPQEGQSTIGWTAGAKLNLNAFITDSFNVRPEWTFIKSLSYGVRYAYDSSVRHPRWTLVLGYDFGPSTPK